MTGFSELSAESLEHVVGGEGERKDFADRYVSTLQQDFKDIQVRDEKFREAKRNGDWGEASKQFGGALLNTAGLLGDAIAPISALKG